MVKKIVRTDATIQTEWDTVVGALKAERNARYIEIAALITERPQDYETALQVLEDAQAHTNHRIFSLNGMYRNWLHNYRDLQAEKLATATFMKNNRLEWKKRQQTIVS